MFLLFPGGPGDGAVRRDAVKAPKEAGGAGTDGVEAGGGRGARGGCAEASQPGAVRLRG